MKWFIQFPLQSFCNLKCPYCFNQEEFKTGIYESKDFFISEFGKFYDKFIQDDECIIEFNGGETFLDKNLETICAVDWILSHRRNISFEFLTNGTLETKYYKCILSELSYRNPRLGFTYHRRVLTPAQRIRFFRNVLTLKSFNIYVKELIFSDTLGESLQLKTKLMKNHNLDLKLQRYRPSEGNPLYLNPQIGSLHSDHADFVDKEYQHIDFNKMLCSCKSGYQNVIIMKNGQVKGCWYSNDIIGNIQTLELKTNFVVKVHPNNQKELIYIHHD